MRTPSLRVDTSLQDYPSLFGRYTAVLSDHERLHRVLSKIGEMSQIVARCDDFPAELRPASLLKLLLAELKEHFRREESDQYFGTLGADSPALAVAVAELCAEHRALLQAVEGLLDLAARSGRERELAVATEGLLAWLDRHEQRESRLMREYLSRSARGGMD